MDEYYLDRTKADEDSHPEECGGCSVLNCAGRGYGCTTDELYGEVYRNDAGEGRGLCG